MFSGVNFSYLSKRNRWVLLLEGSSCFFVFRSQSFAVSTPFDKGKVMKRICVNPLKRDNNIRYVLFKLTNRKQLWVSTYHGAKNSTNIISSPFTPSLKSLSPSSITSEQKTADANKGIKIVEIIILKQNGEDEIMLGSMNETRWKWQPSMDRVGGLWLAFVGHVWWIPWGLSRCDWWVRVLGNASTCLDKHLSPQNTKFPRRLYCN